MWKDLSAKEKGDIIRMAINNGITDLGSIRNGYNKYEEGGFTYIEDDKEAESKAFQTKRRQEIYDTPERQAIIERNKRIAENKQKRITEDKKNIQNTLNGFRQATNKLHEMVSSQEGIVNALQESRNKIYEEKVEKWKDTKRHINNVTNSVEALAALYTLGSAGTKLLGKGANMLGTTYNRYGLPVRNPSNPWIQRSNTLNRLYQQMDKGQTAVNTSGFIADIVQEATEDTDWINKAEIAGDAAGIIGGLNIVRNTPWFGRHRKTIDTALDAMGYTEAGYDALNFFGLIPRKESNSYGDGGSKDSWKPWYWGTPTYDFPTLKEALMQAYYNGREGKNILYKGKAYKVKLNDADLEEYNRRKQYMINKDNPETTFNRVRPNDSPTAKESTTLENDINSRQKSMYYIAKKKGYDSKDYYIPYIYEKEIKIPGIGRLSSNMLDSIAVNAERAGIPLIDAIGLAANETKFGAIPNFSTNARNKAFEAKHGREMTQKEIKTLERNALNSSVARNFGGIHPQYLINDHEWFQRGWDFKDLEDIASPLEHGFRLFRKGKYNTNDPEHTKKVRAEGNTVFNTPVVQQWYRNYKKNKK